MDELLELAQELDGMDRSLNTWEANFLSDMLDRLREKQPLSPNQEAKLREIHEKYSDGEADGDYDQLFM